MGFGELALMEKNLKRTATILSNEDLHVAILKKEDF